MIKTTMFHKIINKKIPADILYQDELVTAFRDIYQQAPVHIIIVPNIIIPTVNDVIKENEITLGRLFTVAAQLAVKKRINESGYRLIVNCNKHGGQEIYHLHMHLLGGIELGPIICKHLYINKI